MGAPLEGTSGVLRGAVLFGRDLEQRQLDDLIDRRAGLVTITGRGGVGRSALAMDAARRWQAEGTAEVVMVSLAAVVDVGAVRRHVRCGRARRPRWSTST